MNENNCVGRKTSQVSVSNISIRACTSRIVTPPDQNFSTECSDANVDQSDSCFSFSVGQSHP